MKRPPGARAPAVGDELDFLKTPGDRDRLEVIALKWSWGLRAYLTRGIDDGVALGAIV